MSSSTLEVVLHDLATTQLLHVSALALLLWDYVLTFTLEVELVWFYSRSWVQACYLLGRWFSIFTQVFNVVGFLSRDKTTEFCNVWFKVFFPIQLMVVWAASSCIVAHRIAALYARHRGVVCSVALLLLSTLILVSVIFGVVVHPSLLTAREGVCTNVSSLPSLYMVMIPPVLFDSVACALALYSTVVQPRSLGTQLALHRVLARDSLLYFLGMAAAFTAQLLVLRFDRETLREATQGMSIALCSICASRMVLSTRGANAATRPQFASAARAAEVPPPRENTAYKGKQWVWANHYP